MIDKKTKFWIDYRNGQITRPLTSKEELQLQLIEEKVNTWMPDVALFKLIGKENIIRYNLYDDNEIIKILAKAFIVEEKVAQTKLKSLTKELRKEKITATFLEAKNGKEKQKINYKGILL